MLILINHYHQLFNIEEERKKLQKMLSVYKEKKKKRETLRLRMKEISL